MGNSGENILCLYLTTYLLQKSKKSFTMGPSIGVLKGNKLQYLKNVGNILTSPTTLIFSRNTLFYKVSYYLQIQ